MGNSGSTGAQSVEEMKAQAIEAQRQRLMAEEQKKLDKFNADRRAEMVAKYGEEQTKKYYLPSNYMDYKHQIDPYDWNGFTIEGTVNKELKRLEDRGNFLSKKNDEFGLDEDESYELEQLIRPKSKDSGYYTRQEELASQFKTKKNVLDEQKKKLSEAKYNELQALKEQNRKEFDELQLRLIRELDNFKNDFQLRYDGQQGFIDAGDIEGFAHSIGYSRDTGEIYDTTYDDLRKKIDAEAQAADKLRQENEEKIAQSELAQQIERDKKADEKKSAYLDKRAAATYKDPVISSLKNYEGCDSGNQMAAQQQQNVTNNAVSTQQQEQKIINYGQSNIQGAGKKQSIKDQMYLINKKYIEMIGEDPYKVNFRVETENEMEGGFLSLIMDIVDMGFMIAGLFQKEESFEEKQTKEYMTQLEEDYKKHFDDLEEEQIAAAKEEEDYQTQRYNYVKSLKDRGLTNDEINNELDDIDNKRTYYSNIDQNIQNEIDNEKESHIYDLQKLKDEFITAKKDYFRDFAVKVDQRDNPPKDSADAAIKAKDLQAKIQKIYEDADKEREKNLSDYGLSYREESKRWVEGSAEWRKVERDKKAAEAQQRFNDEVSKRYKLMEDKIKSELAGYDGCKTNTSNQEKLLHDAKVKVKNDIRAEEEAKAKGEEPPAADTQPTGGSRKRGGKKKRSYN